jgi:hypothetical protein
MENLCSACNVFISHELQPRVLDLMERVRAKVKATLKEHFQDEIALAAAAEKSALVNESVQIKRLTDFARASGMAESQLDADGLIRRAESLLKIWQQADAFEAKLKIQP